MEALVESFDQDAELRGLTVGVAIAPIGGSAVSELTLGNQEPHPAWSTINVAIAVAAERAHGRQAGGFSDRSLSEAITAAIVTSSTNAAVSLWDYLGSPSGDGSPSTPVAAAAAVTAVLREGGDTTTMVASTSRQSNGSSIAGQSLWTLPGAATFTAHLPCMAGTTRVVELMGRVAANQQWGLDVMSAPPSTAVKGGWGPGDGDSFLTRQIGIISHANGTQTAVAISAVDASGSMSRGTAALDAVANWLNRNLDQLPRGRCSN